MMIMLMRRQQHSTLRSDLWALVPASFLGAQLLSSHWLSTADYHKRLGQTAVSYLRSKQANKHDSQDLLWMPTHVRPWPLWTKTADRFKGFCHLLEIYVAGRLTEASDSKTINIKDMDSNPKPHKTARQAVEIKILTLKEKPDYKPVGSCQPVSAFHKHFSQTTVLAHFQAKLFPLVIWK